ncbi:MAG: hypothetical protein UV19_C0018G0001 [Parcubacteria group bacterium GW2011_GWA2_42_28]|nr:MAG: hypothetical protein UV19_C0018G0001 [Parcubacteria group bacterium GW2011_GWA2_42_28]
MNLKKVLLLLFGTALALVVITTVVTPSSLSVKTTNINDGDDVTEEKTTIEGKYTGSPDVILVNGEGATLDKKAKTFSKHLQLQDGLNKVEISGSQDGKEKAKITLNVYFDLEGKLYLEKTGEVSPEEILQYEVVRKQPAENSLTAIIYLNDNQAEERYLTNLIVDLKKQIEIKDKTSILVFPQSAKTEVEEALNSTDQTTSLPILIKYTLADYEKNGENESYFYFPEGLTGTKLAVEI